MVVMGNDEREWFVGVVGRHDVGKTFDIVYRVFDHVHGSDQIASIVKGANVRDVDNVEWARDIRSANIHFHGSHHGFDGYGIGTFAHRVGAHHRVGICQMRHGATFIEARRVNNAETHRRIITRKRHREAEVGVRVRFHVDIIAHCTRDAIDIARQG